MRNKIVEFWENNDKYVYKTDKELKAAIKEAFIAEFIDKPSHWKKLLNDLNTNMLDHLKETKLNEHYDILKWEEMSFDVFCKMLLHEFDIWIDEIHNIHQDDIKNILDIVIHNYIINQLDTLPIIPKFTKTTMYNTFTTAFMK